MMTWASSSVVRPRPPYSSGTVRPKSPSSRMSWMMSAGMSSVSSTIGSAGSSRSRTKRSMLSTRARSCSGSRIMMCSRDAIERGTASGALEDGGDALPPADAHRLEPVAAAAALELVEQGGHDAHTGGAHRVPEGDARAVDVELVLVVPVPALQHRQHLAGEGLVQLDEVHVPERQAGALEELLHGGDRPDAHDPRLAARRRPSHQVAHRLQAQRLGALLAHHQARGGRVVLLRGVAGRDDAVLHDGPELRQCLDGGVGTHALVARDDHRIALALWHAHGHHLVGE